MTLTEVVQPSAPDRAEPLVRVEGLVRKFGDFTAVNNIRFHVKRGEVFGFLGPNGAGKSTTIKMICTLLQPTAGTVSVAGHDVLREADQVRSAIGIVFQDTSLDAGLTAQENLDFHCMMYHIPRAQRAERIGRVLDLMELAEVRNKIVKTYSGGMRRRLEIARGLLHEPQLLILDEPTVGLDPQTRNYIWKYVRGLRDQHGTTIFMTTHYMDEAEYCDRIAIIDKGEIVALDTPAALKRTIAEDQIQLDIRDHERAIPVIEQAFNIPVVRENGNLLIRVPDADHFVPRLLTELSKPENAIQVEAMQVHRPSLEDVFIKLTGRKIREEEGAKDQRRLAMRQRGRL